MCLTAPVVQAQQHSFFTHYSTEDGLSQNTVMSMLQDHKDNLWFATWDGGASLEKHFSFKIKNVIIYFGRVFVQLF